jgi:hypothetical protein
MTPPDNTTSRWRGLFRFSLRQLLLATTFVAVGCYALRWASPWWAIVLFYTGLALIVAGILVAINRGGEARSFWGGFSICGIAHILLVFHPGLDNGIPSLFPAAFVTTWASAYTYHQVRPGLTVQPIEVDHAEIMDFRGRWGSETMGVSLVNGDHYTIPTFSAGEDGYFRGFGGGPFFILEQDFVEVAHGLWTLLLAYVGGCISLAIYRMRPTLHSSE